MPCYLFSIRFLIAASVVQALPVPESLRVGPLVFEPGLSSASQPQRFDASWRGYRISLTTQGISMAGRDPSQSARLRFGGARKCAILEGLDATGGVSNYFLAGSAARSGVPHFRRVLAKEVWPGIDAVFYGNHGNLEYDFVVHPGAKMDKIQLHWDGPAMPRLTKQGDLRAGTVRMKRPKVFQEHPDGARTPVAAEFRLQGRELRIRVEPYDRRATLVIDPEIEFSMLFGGTESDYIGAMITDPAGNIIVTGRTESPNFPTTPNAAFTSYRTDTAEFKGDAYVMKLDPSGRTVLFATFLGGSRSDSPIGLAMNSAGVIVVAGSTTSPDFPVTAGAAQRAYGGGTANDAFVAGLSADGTKLLFSTYVGTSGGDSTAGVAVGPDDSIHLLMNTNNPAYPTTTGAYRRTSGATAMVVKLAKDGSAVLFASALGLGGYFFGIATAPVGGGVAITVDSFGHSFVCGSTVQDSNGVSSTPGALQTTIAGKVDAFVLRLNETGTELVYSTYLGGALDDRCYDIKVDSASRAYITGPTDTVGAIGPGTVHGTPGTASHGYVARISSRGDKLEYAAYLANGSPQTLAVLSSGVAITGYSFSDSYPTTEDAVDRKRGGNAILSILEDEGRKLSYSTYFGQGSSLSRVIASDASGTIFTAGSTDVADFPVTQTHTGSPLGKSDVFLVKWRSEPNGGPNAPALSAGPAALQFQQRAGEPPPPSQFVTVASSASPLSYTVRPPGVSWLQTGSVAGVTSSSFSVSVDGGGLRPGTYVASLRVVSPQSRNGSTGVTVTLNVLPPPPTIQSVSPAKIGAGRVPVKLSVAGAGLTDVVIVDVTPTDGIAISDVRASEESVTAVFAVAANAIPGERRLSVRTRSETSNSVAIAVEPGPTQGPSFAISAYAGSTAGFGGDEGPAVEAKLDSPRRGSFDVDGNLCFADSKNHRIRRVDRKSRSITTIAGTGAVGYTAGTATESQLNNPSAAVFDSRGNLYIADTGNHRVRRIGAGSTSLVDAAGNGASQALDAEGSATEISLPLPVALAADRNDNLYISSAGGMLWKLDVSKFTLRRLTALNGADIRGIAVGPDGELYLADAAQHRIWRYDPANGAVSAVAGTGLPGSGGDGGKAIEALFDRPSAVAVDSRGMLYVADTGNHRIRRIDPVDRVVNTVAGLGSRGLSGDGDVAIAAQFTEPSDLAFDRDGGLYVWDGGNHRIRSLSPVGEAAPLLVASTTAIRFEYTGGPNPVALVEIGGFPVSAPLNAAASSSGGDWLSASLAGNLLPATLRVTAALGTLSDGEYLGVVRVFSGGSALVIPVVSLVRRPATPLVAAPLALTFTHTVGGAIPPAQGISLTASRALTVTASTVTTWLSVSPQTLSTPGSVSVALNPSGLAVGTYQGNVVLTSPGASNGSVTVPVTLRIVAAAPPLAYSITTIAGSGMFGFSGDGQPAIQAVFSQPTGNGLMSITVDGQENIYIADVGNNRIRRVSGGVIQTITGSGIRQSTGDGGRATSASVSRIGGIAADARGNVWFSEPDAHRIRKIEASTGNILTVAGIGIIGFSGDGAAANQARIALPGKLAVDALGNVYFADAGNRRVRRIDGATGFIRTIVEEPGLNGNGGLTVDSFGIVYFTSRNATTVLSFARLDDSASVTAGNGQSDFGGDGGAAAEAKLSNIYGLAVNGEGHLFIADSLNHRIRVVQGGTIRTAAGSGSAGVSGGGFSGDGGPAASALLRLPSDVAVGPSGRVYIADQNGLRIRMLTPQLQR